MATEDAAVLRDAFAVDTCVPTPERCNGVDDDCDGRVDETPEADTACAIPNAAAACIGGRCVVARCDADHGDCDGDAANGCETPLRANADHCGVCGRRCIGLDICVAGSCGPMTDLDVGTDHACAVHASGRVLCWGRNDWAQLGDGTRVDRTRPVEVLGLGPASIVRVGDRYSCALSRDRLHVHCWGKRDLRDIATSPEVLMTPSEFIPVLTADLRPPRPTIAGLYAGARNLFVAYDYGSPTEDQVIYAAAYQIVNGRYRYNIDGPCPVAVTSASLMAPWTSLRYPIRLYLGEGITPNSWRADDDCAVAFRLGNSRWADCQRLLPADDHYAEVTRIRAGVDGVPVTRMLNGLIMGSWGPPRPLEGEIMGRSPLPVVDRLAGGDQAICVLPRGASEWACGNFRTIDDGGGTPVVPHLPISLLPRPSLPHDLQRLRLFHHGEGGCFLSGGGRVLCWGQNHHGRLGDGSTTDRFEPAVVLGR